MEGDELGSNRNGKEGLMEVNNCILCAYYAPAGSSRIGSASASCAHA